jgi:hypothetical protein
VFRLDDRVQRAAAFSAAGKDRKPSRYRP